MPMLAHSGVDVTRNREVHKKLVLIEIRRYVGDEVFCRFGAENNPVVGMPGGHFVPFEGFKLVFVGKELTVVARAIAQSDIMHLLAFQEGNDLLIDLRGPYK